MNLCDHCRKAERSCPIWAPSGKVRACREYEPVTRHEIKQLEDRNRETERLLEASIRRERDASALLLASYDSPCRCVADGDDGSIAHLCEWHRDAMLKTQQQEG